MELLHEFLTCSESKRAVDYFVPPKPLDIFSYVLTNHPMNSGAASTWMLLLDLARAGLKTIVVMAGGCALQANPRIVSHELVAVPRNSLPPANLSLPGLRAYCGGAVVNAYTKPTVTVFW